MPEYILACHGGKKPESEEEGMKEMMRWKAWLDDLGDAVVNPVGMSKTASKDGVADDGGPNPLVGFSVVRADDIGGAIKMAKACPFVDMGTIEVAEMIQMEM